MKGAAVWFLPFQKHPYSFNKAFFLSALRFFPLQFLPFLRALHFLFFLQSLFSFSSKDFSSSVSSLSKSIAISILFMKSFSFQLLKIFRLLQLTSCLFFPISADQVSSRIVHATYYLFFSLQFDKGPIAAFKKLGKT